MGMDVDSSATTEKLIDADFAVKTDQITWNDISTYIFQLLIDGGEFSTQVGDDDRMAKWAGGRMFIVLCVMPVRNIQFDFNIQFVPTCYDFRLAMTS